MKKVLVFLIEVYQRYLSFDRGLLMILAPGGACKFEESCSAYTKRQILEQGVGRGLWLGAKRVWSCR